MPSASSNVYPQRDRIGFNDVLLSEEGRSQLGVVDDYESHLGTLGYAGLQFAHGMANNDYQWRPWHLPESTHVTNWASSEMCRIIKRRDPTRPSFWYLSFQSPHPPLVPPQTYLDIYRNRAVEEPSRGSWSDDVDDLPFALRAIRQQWPQMPADELADVRRAYYAMCTQLDHQLRVVICTLREEQILQETIIMFTADHGDMLGDHGLWSKRLFYEFSALVPMIVIAAKGDQYVRTGAVDDRLVGLEDVMPTLLDAAGVPTPATVEGLSMLGSERRNHLYGEFGVEAVVTRMIRRGRHKLIYYPAGNRFQLFDVEADPRETTDLTGSPQIADTFAELVSLLKAELYGSDLDWLDGDQLVGLAAPSEMYVGGCTPPAACSGRRLRSMRRWTGSGIADIPTPVDATRPADAADFTAYGRRDNGELRWRASP